MNNKEKYVDDKKLRIFQATDELEDCSAELYYLSKAFFNTGNSFVGNQLHDLADRIHANAEIAHEEWMTQQGRTFGEDNYEEMEFNGMKFSQPVCRENIKVLDFGEFPSYLGH